MVYVDDLIIMRKHKFVGWLAGKLNEMFELEFLGEIRPLLGVRFMNPENYITLDQAQYVDQLLDQMSMQDCSVTHTPMATTIEFVSIQRMKNRNTQNFGKS